MKKVMRLQDFMRIKWVGISLFLIFSLSLFFILNPHTVPFFRNILYGNPYQNTISDKSQFISNVSAEMRSAIYMYYYYNRTIPYGNINGQNNLWMLTTPILYYEDISYSITPDPFKPGDIVSTRYWGGQDRYKSRYKGGCIDYYSDGSINFIIRSYGPNGIPDLEYEQITQLLKEYNPLIINSNIYDPTNGTFSKGDIIFWETIPDSILKLQNQ